MLEMLKRDIVVDVQMYTVNEVFIYEIKLPLEGLLEYYMLNASRHKGCNIPASPRKVV